MMPSRSARKVRASDRGELDDQVKILLRERYDAARIDQAYKGVSFELTFEEFLAMITPDQIMTIARWRFERTLGKFFASNAFNV
jgi:hypothetical protein